MTTASAARRAAALLKATECKVVFAESCTGGLVSGTLTKIPGISTYHCGGMVVYRNETKVAWLDIPPAVLKSPGPVSKTVAELMARGVLERTTEADIAIAVTGHLGPKAPPQLDGEVFMASAWRTTDEPGGTAKVQRISCKKIAGRSARQRWVVEQVLTFLASELAVAAR